MANKIFQPTRQLSEREMLERNYNQARYNLLAVVIATLINVVLALVSSDTYFLFTATIPYLLVSLSMLFCGFYPPEYYEGELAGLEVIPSGYLIAAVVISAVIIALYALAYFLSSKGRVGWLIFALVFFSIDTLTLLGNFGISLDMIFDYAFHAWIIVILAHGIRNHYRLKALPEEVPVESEAVGTDELEVPESSSPIRIADMSAKSRVFLKAEANGKQIVYRRVKKINELVIGGYVYDEYEVFVERPHTLTAVIDGHVIEAGINEYSRSFIIVDGELIAKKMRFI